MVSGLVALPPNFSIDRESFKFVAVMVYTVPESEASEESTGHSSGCPLFRKESLRDTSRFMHRNRPRFPRIQA